MLSVSSPRATEQRPVRLAAVPSRRLAQGDTIATSRHPEPVEGSLLKYRQYLNRDSSTSLRSAQNDGKNHQTIPLRMTKGTVFLIISCASENRAFREPCSRTPATHPKGVNAARLNTPSQKQNPRFFVGAVGCALALPQGAMLACALPVLLFPKISQCFRTLRFSGALLPQTFGSIRKE